MTPQTLSWTARGTTTLARGVRTAGPCADRSSELADSMSASTSASFSGTAYGAVPFDRSAPTAIITPTAPAESVPASVPILLADDASAPDEYRNGVSAIVECIRAGGIEKAVLARYRDLVSPEEIDPLAIVRRLADIHRTATVFSLPIGIDRHLVGATPELLIAKDGHDLRSHPLAGSARRSDVPTVERERASALRGSRKDLREHAYVVEAICDILAPHCRRIVAPGPDLLATDTMWHLGTEITAELRDPDTPVSLLAAELHPTPAVCGTPRDTAAEVIAAVEAFDRGFYAGAVGTQDRHGDGEWFVAIRCGEVTPHRVRAYAGAGIVDGSDPDAELAETAGKLETFLTAVSTESAVGAR